MVYVGVAKRTCSIGSFSACVFSGGLLHFIAMPQAGISKTSTKHDRSYGSDFLKFRAGKLVLLGKTFSGQVPEWQKQDAFGEVVFNTGMTGYVESLTDPSYAGQILVFTYPLIGNYGVQLKAAESNKIQVAGVVISEVSEQWSHEGTDLSFLEWLKGQDIPLMTGVDTRALTKYLRVSGTMPGTMGRRPELPRAKLSTHFVSVKEPIIYNPGGTKKVILVDCGCKENIARSLVDLGLNVKRVPLDYDYTKEPYDAVMVSNGPGNPEDYTETINILKKAFNLGKPVFGVCLGNQLLALAAGAKTYKLKFGHRGHNQPCMNQQNGRCYITSQNHGYAIDAKSLPKGWRVSFKNLNDGSVEGIEHVSKPFFSVQFHPEASPGPTDTAWLFEKFVGVL